MSTCAIENSLWTVLCVLCVHSETLIAVTAFANKHCGLALYIDFSPCATILYTSCNYPSFGCSSTRAFGARCSAPAAPRLVTQAVITRRPDGVS